MTVSPQQTFDRSNQRARTTSPKVAALIACAVLAASASTVNAQETFAEPTEDYLEALKSCQSVTEDIARLQCFDAAVGNIVTATETGDVQVIDREDVRETRRSLFGFSLPDIGLFGGGDDDEEEDELFQTTIESVRYIGRRGARFTTAEGAVWEMSNVPRRMRQIRPGDEVVFREASLGYFFVRIEGQTGVKGRRVQ